MNAEDIPRGTETTPGKRVLALWGETQALLGQAGQSLSEIIHGDMSEARTGLPDSSKRDQLISPQQDQAAIILFII